MDMTKNFCETCGAYKACKTFGADGICSLVPSKPKWVRKHQTCKFHRNRKESSEHGRKDT